MHVNQLRCVGLAGLGLMGGSLVRALAERLPGVRLVGHDTDPAAVSAGLRSGLLHASAPNVQALAAEADLVFLCQPLPALMGALCELAESSHLPVLCDVASVKRSVLRSAEGLGALRGRFVAAHPIAGKAESGWAAAEADLFEGRQVVLCPEGADADALDLVRRVWQLLGARPLEMDAARHDEIYAAISHLPQMLTWAFLASLSDQPGLNGSASLAGPGFASFTRLGRSDPALWTGIAMENREALLQGIERVDRQLHALRSALDRGDDRALYALFKQARASPLLDAG